MAETQESRIALLKERVEGAIAAHGPTSSVPFRQQQVDLPRIKIPIAFPMYRLQNGRTHRAQAEYIERNGLDDDFFDDPESDEAQTAQGEILREMIDESGLRDDLERREQRAPLVLTYDGFIVDGNRRTAALRADGEVEQVTAVVLPQDAEATDLYETELELQMARDTKAKYNWVDEALHVQMGIRDLGEKPAAIARRMGTTDKAIEEMLSRLSLVDLYLTWLGAPGKYHRVSTAERSEAEQAFIELEARERRQKFRQLLPLQQRTVRHACFAVIRENGGYKDVRRVADHLINHPEKLVERLRKDLPPDLSKRLDEAPIVAENEAGDGTDGVLGELADAEAPAASAPGSGLLNLVDDSSKAQTVATPIAEAAQDLSDQESEAKELAEPLRKVERALRNLNDVSLSAETPGLADISDTLDELMERAKELSARVEALGGE